MLWLTARIDSPDFLVICPDSALVHVKSQVISSAMWGSVIILRLVSFSQSISEVAKHLPSFVINHGVVTPVEVQKLLNESMVRQCHRSS